MTTKMLLRTVLVLSGMALAPIVASAITIEDFQQRSKEKERPTVIDVRSPSLYQRGHIPNAINVPEEILEQKTLPELGAVVVVTDGLDPEFDARVVASLNGKPGIQAELLEGGMARWNALSEPTTEAAGLSKEEEPGIGYDRLKKLAAKNQNIVLIDVRGNPASAEKRRDLQKTDPRPAGPGPTEAKRETPPKTAVLRAKRNDGTGSEEREFLVIDDGTGLSKEMLRELGGREESSRDLAAGELEREIETANKETRIYDLRGLGAVTRDLAPLEEDFPNARALRASYLWALAGEERERLALRFAAGLDTTQRTTYVLIDDGFGDARRMLATLRRAGVRNCLVLLGGNEVLERDGLPERRVKP